VKQLEDELSASLVIRGHRSIQLTLKGQALYEVLGRNYAALLDSWKEPDASKIVIRAALSFATRALLPKIQQLIGDRRDIAHLLTLPRLHPALDHLDWRSWLNKIHHTDRSVPRNATFFTLDLTLSACLSGHGVAVTDLLLALPELEREYLVCPENARIHSSGWRYFCHQRTQSPIVEERVDWLKQETVEELRKLQQLSERHGWGPVRD
jgi:DNA-binding transcriptional LysR family regulator